MIDILSNLPPERQRSDYGHGYVGTRRTAGLVDSFLKRLGRSLTKQISREAMVKLLHFPCSSEQKESAMNQMESGLLVVTLRIFRDQMRIVLPLQLAKKIRTLILERSDNEELLALAEESTTVIGLFVARLLAEEEIFVHQRVYLSGVKEFSSVTECQKFLESENERQPVFSLSASLLDTIYPVLAVVEQGLVSRLGEYAKFLAPEANTKMLSRIHSKWSLKLEMSAESLFSISRLEKGQFLYLNRFCLEPEIHRAKEGDSNQRTLFGNTICGSKPGSLRLRLST